MKWFQYSKKYFCVDCAYHVLNRRSGNDYHNCFHPKYGGEIYNYITGQSVKHVGLCEDWNSRGECKEWKSTK